MVGAGDSSATGTRGGGGVRGGRLRGGDLIADFMSPSSGPGTGFTKNRAGFDPRGWWKIVRALSSGRGGDRELSSGPAVGKPTMPGARPGTSCVQFSYMGTKSGKPTTDVSFT